MTDQQQRRDLRRQLQLLRFKLKGNGRSEFWEVYLYRDQTIKVDRDSAEVLPGRVPPLGIDSVGFGSSPNLAVAHIICELCLPSECDTSEPDESDVYL